MHRRTLRRIGAGLLVVSGLLGLFLVVAGFTSLGDETLSATSTIQYNVDPSTIPPLSPALQVSGTPTFVAGVVTVLGIAASVLGLVGGYRAWNDALDPLGIAGGIAGVASIIGLPFALPGLLLLLWSRRDQLADRRVHVAAGALVFLVVAGAVLTWTGIEVAVLAEPSEFAPETYRPTLSYGDPVTVTYIDLSENPDAAPTLGGVLALYGVAGSILAGLGAWHLWRGRDSPAPALGGFVGLGLVPWGVPVGVAALALALTGERRVPRAASSTAAGDDRFAIVEPLGHGGMGRTVLARDTVLGREVVLKEMLPELRRDPDRRDAFVEEARTIAALDHPHVVTLHDVLADDGDVTLVMEHVEGGSLADLLDDAPLPGEQVRSVADQLLAALGAVHAEGIVHRDVKPSNVLLAEDGTVKLADFGIAHELGGETAVTGKQPGTILYMAPEQVRGEGVDARTDLYAATAVLYEMLTGRRYADFGDASGYEVQKTIVEDAPRLPVKDQPDDLNAFLAKGLAKDPDDRFESAQAMREALAEVQVGTGD